MKDVEERHAQAVGEMVASQERQNQILTKSLERQAEVLGSALRYLANRFPKSS